MRRFSPLKKWKEGVRSKFSANGLRGIDDVTPKIGPDPDFFNGLVGRNERSAVPATLRLCGPLEPWFDKTWRPGEIELLD